MRLCVREMQTEAADGGTQIYCVGVCMHAHGFIYIYIYVCEECETVRPHTAQCSIPCVM